MKGHRQRLQIRAAMTVHDPFGLPVVCCEIERAIMTISSCGPCSFRGSRRDPLYLDELAGRVAAANAAHRAAVETDEFACDRLSS